VCALRKMWINLQQLQNLPNADLQESRASDESPGPHMAEPHQQMPTTMDATDPGATKNTKDLDDAKNPGATKGTKDPNGTKDNKDSKDAKALMDMSPLTMPQNRGILVHPVRRPNPRSTVISPPGWKCEEWDTVKTQSPLFSMD